MVGFSEHFTVTTTTPDVARLVTWSPDRQRHPRPRDDEEMARLYDGRFPRERKNLDPGSLLLCPVVMGAEGSVHVDAQMPTSRLRAYG